MQILIDATCNEIVVDGVLARGRHRWEAAALATLVQGRHESETAACGVARLNRSLAHFGQAQVLNRKQLSRLWDGLETLWSQADQPSGFAQRFRYAPRQRTVGPWWWTPLANDVYELVNFTSTRTHRLPGLAADESPQTTAALCLHVLMCQGLIAEGELSPAIDALQDDAMWREATAELQALRRCSLADMLIQCRQFQRASVALDHADALVRDDQVAAVYLGRMASLNRQRIAYAQSPAQNYKAVSAALRPLVEAAPGEPLPEVDGLSRSLSLNVAALCERRWLEQNGAAVPAQDRARHLSTALRYSYAALFGALASNQHRLACDMSYNLAYLLQRCCELGLGPTPQDVLEWYGIAHTWVNRFDLTLHFVWGYVFLGNFWLDHPEWRPAYTDVAGRGGWSGLRPDSLAFYRFAVDRAGEIGDPRQIAEAGINLFRFCMENRYAEDAAKVKVELRAVFDQHPDVAELLKAEGLKLP